MLQQRIIIALEAALTTISEQSQPGYTKELKALIKQVRGAQVVEKQARYRCPECDTLLDEGERRCADCNKFGSRVDILGVCPHCDEAIEEWEG